MRPAIGVRRRDAASGRLGGEVATALAAARGPPAGLVERQVQVLVYAYYIGKQRSLVTLRGPGPEVAVVSAQCSAAAQELRRKHTRS